MKIKYLLFLISIFSFAQNKSCVVNYQKNMLVVLKDGEETMDEFSTMVKKAADKQLYVLRFTDEKSKFTIENDNKLQNEDDAKYSYFASIISNDFEYYCDKVNDIKTIKYNDGGLVDDKQKINWQITTDSKYIDSLKCYKAIAERKYKTYKGIEKIYQLIAWFCPQLPYEFGPKEYNSLPGLILEIQDNTAVFTATKIIFSANEITIDMPKGKKMSLEEYEKKVIAGRRF